MKNHSKTGHQITKHIVSFGRVLRRAGLEISTGQMMDALRALEIVGVRSRMDVYQSLYSIFLTRRDQVELFEQAFQIFWRSPSKLPKIMQMILPELQSSNVKHSKRVQQALAETDQQNKHSRQLPTNEKKETVDVVLTYSPMEVLRNKDFASFSTEEVLQAKKFLRKMQWQITPRPTRRFIPQHKGRKLDLRKSLQQSLRLEGEFFKLKWRAHNTRPRDITILCDVSGSMERYTRMLLHFMHTVTYDIRRVETFVFGTRLNRITRMLRLRDIDEAVDSVTKAVTDWGGGTRIGEAIKDFNYTWARRVLRSSSVVMIISDGWDRGDIPLLEREMGRLSRSCHRLIWLNPLLGYRDYEPLTRGMKTVLPYVDDFLPVHNLESLEQLGKVLGSIQQRPKKITVRS